MPSVPTFQIHEQQSNAVPFPNIGLIGSAVHVQVDRMLRHATEHKACLFKLTRSVAIALTVKPLVWITCKLASAHDGRAELQHSVKSAAYGLLSVAALGGAVVIHAMKRPGMPCGAAAWRRTRLVRLLRPSLSEDIAQQAVLQEHGQTHLMWHALPACTPIGVHFTSNLV